MQWFVSLYGLPNLRIWAELNFWLLPPYFEHARFLATFATKFSRNNIFLTHLKFAFRMSFRDSNIDPFEVSAFYLTGLFSRMGYGYHSIINWRTCCHVKRNKFWSIMSNYSFPAQSVVRPNKHKKWCCDSQVFFKPTRKIRLKKRKYTRSTVSISALWIFLQTQISGLIPIKGRLTLRGQMFLEARCQFKQINCQKRDDWHLKGVLCCATMVSYQALNKCKFQSDQIWNSYLVIITFIR